MKRITVIAYSSRPSALREKEMKYKKMNVGMKKLQKEEFYKSNGERTTEKEMTDLEEDDDETY